MASMKRRRELLLVTVLSAGVVILLLEQQGGGDLSKYFASLSESKSSKTSVHDQEEQGQKNDVYNGDSIESGGSDASEDWFKPDTSTTHFCFYVEDMCHSHDRWFYRENSSKHQPNFTLQSLVSTVKERT